MHYKFVDKNKNDVKLSAVSYGGQSLLEVEDLPSTVLLGNVIQTSGLGEFSAIDLPKILAGKKTDEILGVHIIGARAADLIAEAVIAMEFRASSEDIARSSHAHPTYTEAFKEACLAVNDRAIHS